MRRKQTMKIRIARLVATWFGCGLFPIAPGTVGSAAAVAIAVVLHWYAGFLGWHFLLLAAALAYPAVWSAGVAARAAKIEDPGFVVVDEVLGQWITLSGAMALNWKSYLAAFLLFRLFDIWKPAPVRQLESLPGGIGINADDAMAGVYSALVMLVLGRLGIY
jgi:phosphatidylglycerophosphatase A